MESGWAVHLCAQELVESPLVHAGIVPAGFVDSYALNLYHDGRSGPAVMADTHWVPAMPWLGHAGNSKVRYCTPCTSTVLSRSATAVRAFRVIMMTPGASIGQSTRCASSPTHACRLAPRCMGESASPPAIAALCCCVWHVLRCIYLRTPFDARGGPDRQ